MKANLFVIGASKCGTTSLYHILDEHPNICMSSVKETNYFALPKKAQQKIDYDKYYSHCNQQKIKGEVSPIYSELHVVPKIPEEIYRYNKRAKIIYVIRDPIDRLRSVWKQTLHSGHWYRQIYKEKFDINIPKMSLNFEEAVFNYPPFLESCKYWKQIQGYRKFFPDDQIKVLLFENFVKSPDQFLKEIWDFLDIESINLETIKLHYNKSQRKMMLNPKSNCLFLAKPIRMLCRLPFSENVKNRIKKIVYKPVPKKIKINNKLKNKILDFLANDREKMLAYMNKE